MSRSQQRSDPALGESVGPESRAQFVADLRARFPGKSIRILRSTGSGRHLVAEVGEAWFAKAAIDPAMTIEAEARSLYAARGYAEPTNESELRVPGLIHPSRPSAVSWMMTTRVRGKPARAWAHAHIARVGRSLASLHSVRLTSKLRPLPGGSTLPSALREADVALDRLKADQVITSKTHAVGVRALRRARAQALTDDDESPRVLCHGDVRGPNVLFDEATTGLVDFEHSGRGDAALDLARTAAYQRLSRHETFLLLDTYAEATSDDSAVDRAISILASVRLGLALQAVRHLQAALSGRVIQRDLRASERVAKLEARLGELLELEVKLSLGIPA
ncbi:MAG: aminoglycoside phosphotransferase family protein [Deltaproteobacteria bacterium]|nr:aminoglycoside phosphotransferase family protein [Deltaproteobacteria bacterium]